MANLSASVDASGISAPTYSEILAAVQDIYRAIYGSDVYLEPDSQDGQFLAIFALAVKDCNDTAIDVYNEFSPSTAVGAGLSSVVKVNGLRRQIATYSTVVVTVVGQAGITIPSGLIGDNLNLGTIWTLPSFVTIPDSGQIDVTATSVNAGAINLSSHTITRIMSPIPGWQTVDNAASTTPGAPVESDSQLRQRQSKSTALPAITPLNGIYAAVANVPGVSRAAVYENDTGFVNELGIPAHSIAVVVEGGDLNEVAKTVSLKKAPGVPTYGTIPVVVFDAYGVPATINLNELFLAGISVLLFIDTLPGYATGTTATIKTAMAYYVTNLNIGEASYLGRLYSPANLAGDEAVQATGHTQLELDSLSNTYAIDAIAQTRDTMFITNGPQIAGSTSIIMYDATNMTANSVMYLSLTDGSYHKTIIQSVVGQTITFSPAIPAGKIADNNSLVYLSDDIMIHFSEGCRLFTSDIIAIDAQTNAII